MDTKNKQKEIEDFVLRHYEHGKLDTQQALHNVRERLHLEEDQPQQFRMLLFHSNPLRQRLRHYAAAIALVMVMVSAYAIYRNATRPQPTATEQVATPQRTAPSVPKTFHFDQTPINVVLSELSAYYGVALATNDTTRHLTGDFEADDLDLLLSMIEQTLNINIEKKKAER